MNLWLLAFTLAAAPPRVDYGKLHGFLSVPPGEGKRPGVVYLTGGFPGGGFSERGVPFSDAGAVVLYPTYRGTDGNAGAIESFKGEVDDVLAAVAWLSKHERVERVYLVGHSTGGTLALLAAAKTDQLAGVIAFGPAADACAYAQKELKFDVTKPKECELRAPKKQKARVPVFVIEGELGRVDDARELKGVTVAYADHYNVVEPVAALAAREMMQHELKLARADVQDAFDGPQATVKDASGWSVQLPKGFKPMQGGAEETFRRGNLVVMFQRQDGPIAKDCAAPKEFSTFKEKWGKHDICGLRMALREKNVELVSLVLQVPFAPRALSLQLIGPVTAEAELVALARELLPNVKGPTSWK